MCPDKQGTSTSNPLGLIYEFGSFVFKNALPFEDYSIKI